MQKVRLMLIPLLLLQIGMSAWSQSPSVPIKEFVTKNHVHGVPYKEAKAYGKTAIPELITLLNDPKYDSYRSSIVLTIGMIGDTAGIKPLKEFLFALKGEVSMSTFVSVLGVFQALGYIAQSGDQRALKFLADWSTPDFYKNSGIAFTYGIYKGKILGYIMRKIAIQGLGISGRPEALQKLQELNNTQRTRKKSSINNDLAEAMEMNRKVKTEGAARVFGKEVTK